VNLEDVIPAVIVKTLDRAVISPQGNALKGNLVNIKEGFYEQAVRTAMDDATRIAPGFLSVSI
jgi:hypothetical protein